MLYQVYIASCYSKSVYQVYITSCYTIL